MARLFDHIQFREASMTVSHAIKRTQMLRSKIVVPLGIFVFQCITDSVSLLSLCLLFLHTQKGKKRLKMEKLKEFLGEN